MTESMAAQRSSPRVLVAQIGARRRYAVAKALDRSGCLDLLITDACADVRPWTFGRRIVPAALRRGLVRAGLDRRVDGVDPRRIRGNLTFFLSARIGRLRARAAEPRAEFWLRQNQAFARAVGRVDWSTANTVYAFNGAALEIFEKARQRGMRCVLDQTAAPWRYNTRLLLEEQSRWPGWEDAPADIDVRGQMAQREEAEWGLADRIVCGSSFVVDAIRAVGGPADKCRVVRYPVPNAPAPTQPANRDRRLRVLFVGTLQLRKGIQYVHETAGRLGQTDFEFRAVGPSSLTQKAERLIRATIDIRGRVTPHEVWEHYSWADVFFLPTLSEGSSNACWEALGARLPVLTTGASGLEQSDHVMTMPRGDVDQMADYLTRLACDGRPHRAGCAPGRSIADYAEDLTESLR
jgi:glycosyltransferase involved in cell wall biosynthesis